jgi:DNA-binding transcriptional regulator YhcF (GntR family)
VAWKHMAQELANKQLTKGAMLAGMRQLAKSLGIQLTRRKALQMIPLIGAVVGASLNGVLAHDIGKTAYMSYRRRWMQENGESSPLALPDVG